eukprot:10538539-Karenia_brevis.AAC.1
MEQWLASQRPSVVRRRQCREPLRHQRKQTWRWTHMPPDRWTIRNLCSAHQCPAGIVGNGQVICKQVPKHISALTVGGALATVMPVRPPLAG